MELIFGTLSITDLSSFLEPGDAWLLMSGFPDANQAGAAATNFIVNVKHLGNGTDVAVTGSRSAVGTQPVIIMTDINAAGTLMQHAVATPEFQARKAVSDKRKRKPSGRSQAKGQKRSKSSTDQK